MRVVSQNGWPVLNADATTVITAGGRAWRLARGQVATVFKEFITRYHREVEKVDYGQLDDWSWAVRTVRGSTTVISNHASGTAIDLNALRHARGAQGTFDNASWIALHTLLDDFPVLRWGGTFGTTVDEMHFEVACTPAQLDTWQRTGIRPPSAAGTAALTRPTDPEDDVVTRADIDAIAEAVWAKALDSRSSDPRGAWSARDRLASLDYSLQNLVLPALDAVPKATSKAVWDGTDIAVHHPQSDVEQAIPMGTALGRAASVIWDGLERGVLHEQAYLAATVQKLDADPTAMGYEAETRHALAGIGQQLEAIVTEVQALAVAVLDPAPVQLAGSTDHLALPDVARQTHARTQQLLSLLAGVREGLDTLAVAAAKGSLPDAEKLQDAMIAAIRSQLPQVMAPATGARS